MKKFYFNTFRGLLLSLMLLFAVLFASAQTAIQTSKLTDNISLGVNVGATGPMTMNLSNMFPLNATIGLTATKQVTPILGFNLEGMTWLGSNTTEVAGTRFDHYIAHNTIRAFDLGANTTLNLTNLFKGYQSKPRVFEYGIEGGIGWLHTLIPNAPNDNDFSAKTQINFMFNLGKSRASTLSLSPVIWWNLTGMPDKVSFNRNYAQLGLLATYTYHFKNSHGKHYFKTYDISAMQNEIDALQEKLADQDRWINELRMKKPNTVLITKDKPVFIQVPTETVVYFAFDDFTLDNNATNALDRIPKESKVSIVGTASTEGTEDYNLKLSQNRADAVADYLKARGVTVEKSEGIGTSFGRASNRVAIVTLNK